MTAKNVLTALVAVFLLDACGGHGTPAADTLTVFAAASLTVALTEIGREFEARHPGVVLRFNFAGTQILTTQIEQGAAADLFVGADQLHARRLLQAGTIEVPVVVARNRLVIIVPRSNPARLARPFDLARRGIKLDLAAPDVPAGTYARQAISNLAAEPGAPPNFTRLVLGNVVSQEETVESVVGRVALEEVDAGIVYYSDLATPNGRRVTPITIPTADNVLAEYPAAVLKGSRRPVLARAFLDDLSAPAARQIFRRLGFEEP